MKSEVIYLSEERPYVTLTTYLLDASGELTGSRRRPAVLICPGGAYLTCSDREAEPVALRFAAMGYQAFVLRYTTYMRGDNRFPSMDSEFPCREDCVYPRQMRDIGAAMLTIAAHAKEWRTDTEQIVLCGFSAGAHNAALYTVNCENPILTDCFHVDSQKLRPAAVILGYTLSDYVLLDKLTPGTWQRRLFDVSNIAFLGTDAPDEETLRAVSPAALVTENLPPFFLWATAEDNMVPVQHSLRMAEALADKGVPFELHIFENGPHGLSLATQATARTAEQICPETAKWIDMADAFLARRLRFPLLGKR